MSSSLFISDSVKKSESDFCIVFSYCCLIWFVDVVLCVVCCGVLWCVLWCVVVCCVLCVVCCVLCCVVKC
jgi:hypothetical protein